MKRRRKILLALLGVMLLLLVPLSTAFADPEYGRITGRDDPTDKGNPQKHIVRNFIYGSGDDIGWVTFACQSVEGFQYSVAVKGLASRTTYDVQAVSLGGSDGAPGVIYPLGTIRTNGKGEGEVRGLVPLPLAGHFLVGPIPPFLPVPAYVYNWDIQVVDAAGVVVLSSPAIDPVDFVVFDAWL